jgi:hypothetical protein
MVGHFVVAAPLPVQVRGKPARSPMDKSTPSSFSLSCCSRSQLLCLTTMWSNKEEDKRVGLLTMDHRKPVLPQRATTRDCVVHFWIVLLLDGSSIMIHGELALVGLRHQQQLSFWRAAPFADVDFPSAGTARVTTTIYCLGSGWAVILVP